MNPNLDIIEELVGIFTRNDEGELVFNEDGGEQWLVDPHLGFNNVLLGVKYKVSNARKYIRIQDSSLFPQTNSSYYNTTRYIAFECCVSEGLN